jgi:hypothetical protein
MSWGFRKRIRSARGGCHRPAGPTGRRMTANELVLAVIVWADDDPTPVRLRREGHRAAWADR